MIALLAGGCAEPPPDVPDTSYRDVLDVPETMRLVIEPAADLIWDSAGTIDTVEGREDLAPTTDEGWAKVEHATAVLIESGNLLMMPARTNGEPDWVELSNAMTDVGLQLQEAAQRQDPDAIFDLGGNLYNVCVACHSRYWIQADD